MMKTAFLLAVAGAALMTACAEPSGGENNLAGDNLLAIDGNVLANVAGDIAPLNEAAEAPAANDAAAAGSSAVEQPRPAAPVRTPSAPAARPEPAPKADRPARTERSAPRPAPKQEPSPPPASTCTPEHEAMGHCKQ